MRATSVLRTLLAFHRTRVVALEFTEEALPTYQLVQNGRLLLQFTGSDDVKLKMETIRFGRGLGLSTQKHRLAR